ncbi:PREDICTED: coiled-coil domain-containing protein 116, partial [Bison bison bison]|uniref:Coiled-coil domain-containing protein 116 n=1 Tax=Bison bison bison TaxID=43346 RepID=A0A6P3H744_BISBB
MASCRHHSGYLADDEAGHPTYVARVQPPKKSLFSEMGHASKPGHRPHPPSSHDPSGSSGRCRNRQGPRPFRSFLDFLVEGQVLESLQTVVEEATERMATVKTEAGVPLVEMQDPVEVPRSPGCKFSKKKPLPSILSRSSSVSQLSNPWHEELVDYLKDQAVSLLVHKYSFEKSLADQLGFISFPVTEVLMDLYLGFKKVKGSHVRLSSTVDWHCLLRQLEEAESSQRSSRLVFRAPDRPTSQHSTPRRGLGTPATPSEVSTRGHRIRDKPTGPSRLDTRPKGSRPHPPQEHSRPPEAKRILSPTKAGVASHPSEQTVDMEDRQSMEEEDEEEEDEEEEEEDEQEE